MRMKLLNLKEHPENKHIYESCCVEDLKTSLNIHGQMEPIAIIKMESLFQAIGASKP